ncbi:DEAD/DEAH box helicase family protein [Plantactinospora siamensis]|uniref:DEAD/DEAH box helicase family protein n=1 Tax=Plantactinospora siamensis TaxID=555372 RepID=A0ABV6P331_9ACTN
MSSLARRDDVATLAQGYGHVIVDECHHLGAAAHEQSVKRIAAQLWLGLTATPTRRKGLGRLAPGNSDPSATP